MLDVWMPSAETIKKASIDEENNRNFTRRSAES